MNDLFDLPVIYNGEETSFPAQLLQIGYTHRFKVEVFEQELFFEPDEEGSYRALIDPEKMNTRLNTDLLKAIAEAIEQVLK